MPKSTRTLLVASCLALVVAAACGGGSPTEPSGAGATVAGLVSRTSGPLQGLTVSVEGTSLAAQVESSGYFQITNVPSGTVRLKFKDATVDATAQIPNVGTNEFIEIQVQVGGSTATIVSETRSEGKVQLCHKTGNGTYHLIDVSVNAESAHRAHGDAKVGEPVPAAPAQVFDASCSFPGAPQPEEDPEDEEDEEDEEQGEKVQLCHRTGNGRYQLIEVSVSAEPAHRAHGDGMIGEPVPGSAGKVFGPGCTVQ